MTKPSPKRMAIWRHNAAIGQARWAYVALSNVAELPTITKETKELLTRINSDLYLLQKLIRERKATP